MSTLYNERIINTLRLEPLELAILEHTQESTSLTKISGAAGCPRTTLYPYITKLVQRGLLEKIKQGKRFVYRAINPKISPSFMDTSLSDDTVSIFKGRKQLSEAWLLIGNEPARSTVVGIQPNSSLIHSLSKSDKTIAKKNHTLLVKKKIFMDYITEEGMYDLVKNTLKKDISTYENDFTQRMSSITTIPSRYFQKSTEIFILTRSVLFLDWKNEIGYEIKNENVRFMMMKYAELLKDIGKISNNYSELQKMFR